MGSFFYFLGLDLHINAFHKQSDSHWCQFTSWCFRIISCLLLSFVVHRWVYSLTPQSKYPLPSPALSYPPVVHSDLRIPFLAYLDQKKYSLKTDFFEWKKTWKKPSKVAYYIKIAEIFRTSGPNGPKCRIPFHQNHLYLGLGI